MRMERGAVDVAVAATAQRWVRTPQAASLTRRPWLPAAGLAGLAVAAHLVMMWRRVGGAQLDARVDDLVQVTVAAVAAGACFVAARRQYSGFGRAWTTALRRAWTLLGVSTVVWGLGALTRAWYELVLGHALQFPSAIDAAFLVAIPLQVAAVLAFPSAPVRTAARLRMLLDGLLIASCLVGLSWATVLGALYHQQTGSVLARSAALAYPIGAIVTVTFALTMLAQSRRGSSPGQLALVSLALFSLAVADSGFAYLMQTQRYTSGSPIDVGWVVGFLLLAVTTLWPPPRPLTSPADDDRPGLGALALPYMALTAAILIGAINQLVTGKNDKLLILDGLLIAALVACRQLLTLLENQQLTKQLRSTIDELYERESELERTLEREKHVTDRLRQVDTMKDTFLHAVSHDLRTPLTAILGVALTLERARMNLPPDKATELLHMLVQKARKLDRLLSDLLDLNRLEQGVLEPNRSPTDLGALIRKLAAEVDQLDGWPVTVVVGSVMASVDGPKIERIVENLLVNATRHTPRGTPVWVRVEARGPRGRDLELIVEDAGPGVPKELAGSIFEPFEQGLGAPAHSPGVGIGLSLVSRFAQLHGGHAWVAEREGGGAAFHVLLPGAALDDSTAFKPETPGSGPSGRGERWREWSAWRARRARAATAARDGR